MNIRKLVGLLEIVALVLTSIVILFEIADEQRN
jgi:hypothetical protein